MTDNEPNQPGDVVNAELAHKVGPMVFGGFDAYIELRRDLLAAVALRDEDGDFPLPRGEEVYHGVGLGDRFG